MVGAVEATSRSQGGTGKWHAIDKLQVARERDRNGMNANS